MGRGTPPFRHLPPGVKYEDADSKGDGSCGLDIALEQRPQMGDVSALGDRSWGAWAGEHGIPRE